MCVNVWCLPNRVEVYVLLVLARHEVHHGQRVRRGDVSHPVRNTRVGSVKVIVIAIFKYLQTIIGNY